MNKRIANCTTAYEAVKHEVPLEVSHAKSPSNIEEDGAMEGNKT